MFFTVLFLFSATQKLEWQANGTAQQIEIIHVLFSVVIVVSYSIVVIVSVRKHRKKVNLLPQTGYEASVRCICGIGFSPYSENVEFTTIINSLNDVEDYTDASIFPNPVTNTLYVNWTGQENRRLQAEIYNVTGGKTLLSQSDVSAGVKTNNLTGGVYFLRLTADDGTQRTLKFIKS